MGQQASSCGSCCKGATDAEAQEYPDGIPDNEARDNHLSFEMVNVLSEQNQLNRDLQLSSHQLAELGKTEAIRIKLRKETEEVNKLDREQLSPLHYAARYNQVATAQVLLYCKADVNITGKDNRTPLHYAARCQQREVTTHLENDNVGDEGRGAESMIILLKRYEADVNARDNCGQTPFHFAAMVGNVSAAEYLIQFSGADMQVNDNHQMTPLIVAAAHGHLDMVNFFLEKEGTDIRHADNSKQTALHHAAKGGHLNVVQRLIKGSDMENFLDGQDCKKKTPLFHAANNGYKEVAAQLLTKGAYVEAQTSTFATPLHAAASIGSVEIIALLLQHKAVLDARDLHQRTPLMYAAAGNHIKAISRLLDADAEIDKTDSNKLTALLIATQKGHAKAIETLLKRRADPKAVDKLDKSATFHCVKQGKTEALKVLLKGKRADWDDGSLLHIAVQKGNIEAVKLLQEKGVSCNTKNKEKNTVLHVASKEGYASIVQELLPNSSTMVNAENEDLDTPLHLGSYWGHEDVVMLLVEAGASVSSTNNSRSTPLHLAALNDHLGCCQLLLDSNAPIDEFNKENKTPLMLAVLKNHVGVTHLLLEHGASLDGHSRSEMNALELAVENGKRDIASTIVQFPGWEVGMRKISKDEEGNRITPLRRMIEKLPSVAEEVLNRCIKTRPKTSGQDKPEQFITFEYIDDTYQMDIQGLNQFNTDGTLKANSEHYNQDANKIKENHPLMLMIKNKQLPLLSHPVCIALINHKWTAYGRKVYFANFGLYLTFLISLTAYLIHTRNLSWIKDSADEVDMDSWEVSLLMLCQWVTLITAFVGLIKEIFQAYRARLAYINLVNIVELTCYACAILFVLFDGSPYKEVWQWQVGATSILFSWINLLLFFRVFPFFGINIIMFIEVLKTFSRFFLLFFFVIIAFSLSFYTVMGGQGPFQNPFLSLLKTSVMMTAEINYDDTIESLTYPKFTYFLIAFMVFMSILLMNLLLGLAVDDIKAVQEEAKFQKLAMKAKLVLDVDMLIPLYMKKNYILQEKDLINKLKIHHGNEIRKVCEKEDLRHEVRQLKQSMNTLMEMTSSLKDLVLKQQSEKPTPYTQPIPSTSSGIKQHGELGLDF